MSGHEVEKPRPAVGTFGRWVGDADRIALMAAVSRTLGTAVVPTFGNASTIGGRKIKLCFSVDQRGVAGRAFFQIRPSAFEFDLLALALKGARNSAWLIPMGLVYEVVHGIPQKKIGGWNVHLEMREEDDIMWAMRRACARVDEFRMTEFQAPDTWRSPVLEAE